MSRRPALPRAFAALSCAVVGAVSVVITPGAPAAAAPTAVARLAVEGHGYGHGIGMGQWGAYGYAADHGWTADRILDHFYGGTVAGTVDAADPAARITVRLQRLDDLQTAVVHDRNGALVDGVAGGPWAAVVARETAPGAYTVWASTRPSCPAPGDPLGGWAVVASGIASVTVRPVGDDAGSASFTDVGDLLSVCDPNGLVRTYRGSITALNGPSGENRTVNTVPVEQYLRSVIASEMSPSWAARGSEALRAQAVASRSYALAERREPYAATCDLICQFYPGAATRTALGASYRMVEYPSTDAAVASTAGMVRRVGSADGEIALTMFSSSSGGATMTSTLDYPAVVDEGDDTAANPYHSWTIDIGADVLATAYPSLGTITDVEVLSRTGVGEWGGRVVSIRVTGTAGSTTTTGERFRRAVGMRSNYFTFTVHRDGAATPPSTEPSPRPDSQCAGRDAPPVVASAVTPPPSRFTPITPQRLIDTRDGTGTTAAPLGVGCTLQVRPPVPTGATAVTVNLVAVRPAADGFLTVYPCGTPRPLASTVQSSRGRIVNGPATVPLGADGTFCVFSNVAVEVVVDLFGWFAPGIGDRFEPISGVRRYDSRPSRTPVGPGQVVRVSTRGGGAAPAGSTGASLTVHATDAVTDGFVTVWPCDRPRPWASSLNVTRGTGIANSVEVAVGSTGEVCLFTSTTMHLTVDLHGWFGPAATAEFNAVTPARVADTRESGPWRGALGRFTPRRLVLEGVGGLPSSGVRSVVAQVTAVGPAATGFASVLGTRCPSGSPSLSMLRFPAGRNVAALVNLPVDPAATDGEWCVVTSTTAHLVVDVSGWYG